MYSAARMFMRRRVVTTSPRRMRRAVSAARQYSLDSTRPTGMPRARIAAPMRRAVSRPPAESWRIRAGSQLVQSPLARTRSSLLQSVAACRK